MDIKQVKNKLNALNSASTKREKVDFKAIMYKPQVGKQIIRVVPRKSDPSNPFTEIYYHYNYAKYPVLALNNWGEKDPIIEFCKELKTTGEREDWILSQKLSPKMRVFVPVIVRGEEEKGVRLYEFGAQMYKTLLGYASSEDYENYDDVYEGRDFTIEGIKVTNMGREIIQCTVMPKPKQTPLSTDPKLVEKWLTEQPDILEINQKPEFDFVKGLLEKFLNPAVEVPVEGQPETSVGSQPKFSSAVTKKKSGKDEFDGLFDEAKPEVGTPDDDLPF